MRALCGYVRFVEFRQTHRTSEVLEQFVELEIYMKIFNFWNVILFNEVNEVITVFSRSTILAALFILANVPYWTLKAKDILF